MPNTRAGSQTVYVITGNPDTSQEETAFRPGEIGQTFEYDTKSYQAVKLDSGATAATPSGVVAANQLAYWKDKTNFVVTNDLRQSNRNNVAGIFRMANTAGYERVFILQRGDAISVKSDGAGAVGDSIIADATSTQVTNIAAGSAPTYQKLGTVTAVAGGGNITADVDINPVP